MDTKIYFFYTHLKAAALQWFIFYLELHFYESFLRLKYLLLYVSVCKQALPSPALY